MFYNFVMVVKGFVFGVVNGKILADEDEKHHNMVFLVISGWLNIRFVARKPSHSTDGLTDGRRK